MAEIQKREIIQNIVDGLRIEGGTQVVPTTTEEKVRIVFIANGSPKISIVDDASSTTTGASTLIVPRVGKRTFVTNLQLSYMCDATADSTDYRIEGSLSGKTTTFLFAKLIKQTLTAANDSISINFDPPLELAPGVSLFVRQTFTVGTSTVNGTVIAYEQEP